MCLKDCSQGESICVMQVALASFGEINKNQNSGYTSRRLNQATKIKLSHHISFDMISKQSSVNLLAEKYRLSND